MKTTVNILIISLAFFAGACGASNENHEHQENSSQIESGAEKVAIQHTPSITDPDANPREAEGILGAYLKLKAALVATSQEDAKAAAEVLKKAANEHEDIAALAGEISSATTVAIQRQHFEKLSIAVYELAKEGENTTSLYKQYCPMALDGKGAFWISSSEDILNPYFGDKMLKCGSVQEVIAGK